jgi:hypothetical protein
VCANCADNFFRAVEFTQHVHQVNSDAVEMPPLDGEDSMCVVQDAPPY